jgi:hypothetical protein
LLKKHSPCHSEASFIGVCLPPAAKQQIPRATIPRFGMTILWGFFKLHHYLNPVPDFPDGMNC